MITNNIISIFVGITMMAVMSIIDAVIIESERAITAIDIIVNIVIFLGGFIIIIRGLFGLGDIFVNNFVYSVGWMVGA